MYRIIAGIQALYYLVTGIWPLADMDSFVAATGPKTDLWLVEMVGLLAAAIGAGVAYAVVINSFSRPLLLLLILSAAGFMYIDIYYSLHRLISFMYLPDAVCQLIFLISHVVKMRRG